MLNIQDIMATLPHRYPFLLVDRIVELEPLKRVVGIKNVTINEDFFNGHFPGHPVMPGVLIVEAMAQVSGFALLTLEEHKGKIVYFASIDNVKFRQPVVPGDQLRIEAEVIKVKGSMARVQAKAIVDGKVVTEGELMFAVGK